MVDVIHAAFGARPPLDPPSTAIEETPESIRAQLAAGGGIYATVDGAPAGLDPAAPGSRSSRARDLAPGLGASVLPAARDRHRDGRCGPGLRGRARLPHRVELFAREEFTELIAFWQHRGFAVVRPAPQRGVLARSLPVAVDVPTAEQMQELGRPTRRAAATRRPGDRQRRPRGRQDHAHPGHRPRPGQSSGAVISPTFVLSRIHPSRSAAAGPGARRRLPAHQRRASSTTSTSTPPPADAVTVVEWGAGLAEGLADHRLEIDIRRSAPPDRSATSDPDEPAGHPALGGRAVVRRRSERL